MGDRISISFKMEDDESISFFSHWEGLELLEEVKLYLKQLGKYDPKIQMMPRDRREPNTIMLDFIIYKFRDTTKIESGYYLGKDKNDGDNSDNGHWIIDLKTNKVKKG